MIDAEGRAAFDLPDGEYRIRADLLGYQFWSESITLPTALEPTLVIARADLTVDVQRTYLGDLLPLAGAPVYLFDPAGTYLGESRVTDAAGAAGFVLPVQSFLVRADYLGVGYWSAPFAGTSPQIRFLGGGVADADAVTTIALSTGGGVFSLTVDDGAGAGLGGLPVYLFSAAGSYLGIQGATDAQGRVEFTLSDGSYRFRVDELGRQFWTPVYTLPAETSALLAIPHGTARIHLTADGADVAAAPVYLFGTAGDYLGRSAATDAAGIAQFNLPEGTYLFRADHLGAQLWSQAVTIVGQSVQEVEIVLAP